MSANTKQYVPVFLSSTRKDLIPFRAAVLGTLEKLKVAVNGMEVFGARTEEPLETCLDEVRKCRVFVGVIAMRYGSIDEKTGKSFVQREYETAIEKDQDIHIYLLDEERASGYPPMFVEKHENATKLEEFKELLQKSHTTESYVSPEDLAIKVERDLLRSFKEKGLVVERGQLLPAMEVDKTLDILRRFNVMPGRLSGREVELTIRFDGESDMVGEDECRILGVDFGRSIRRRIKVIHPEKANDFQFLRYLVAEYERADEIYEAKPDREYKIIGKLIFGSYETRTFVTNKHNNLYSNTMTFVQPEPYVDLETGQHFYNYVRKHKVDCRGLVLRKVLN